MREVGRLAQPDMGSPLIHHTNKAHSSNEGKRSSI